ncbi:Alanine racemase OS=Streptomyces tendae OX=1932 GN=alr PE=3 SV=1 [Streptomyces tendae]
MTAYAERQGLRPEVRRHRPGSPATLTLPDDRFSDSVRPGIAMYGVSAQPGSPRVPGRLRTAPRYAPAASAAWVKQVPGDHGVSYGHHYTTPGGHVPSASSRSATRTVSRATPPPPAPSCRWKPWRTVAGRIAMDQFVVDLAGTCLSGEAVLFGPGDRGEPTAQDWAQAAGTIAYQIVTRIGSPAFRASTSTS